MRIGKIKTLQIIRGLAFLGICLGHFGDRVVIPSIFSGWGVTVFFILSGFLNMIHGYHNDTHNKVIDVKYSINKIRKLYPLVVITTIISFFLETYHYKETVLLDIASYFKTSVVRLIVNILLVSNWFPKSHIFKEYNIVVWFISTLFLYYFFTPFFVHVISGTIKQTNKMVLIKMALIYIFDIFFSVFFWVVFENKENAWWFIYENPLVRVWEYLLGMILAAFYIKNHEKSSNFPRLKTSKLITLMIVSGLMTVVMWLIDIYKVLPAGLMSSSNGFFYTLPSMGLIYSSSMLDERISSVISQNKILHAIFKIGELSVYAYLLHVPIINVIHSFLWRINACIVWLWCALSMTFLFVCSMAFDLYFGHRSLNTDSTNSRII